MSKLAEVQENTFPKIFSGVKILDFSRLLPGPFASMLLNKMGAEVRCVLPPHEDPIIGNYSPFKKLREGKQFFTLDLKTPDGVAQAKDWLRESPILLEGFRPGTMDRLGLGFEEAKKLRPDLLYVSLVGYSPDHPKFYYAAHDLNFLVDSGLYSLIYSDQESGIPAIQLADIVGGFYAAFHIVCRWIESVRKPEARFLRVSMIEALELISAYLKHPETLNVLSMLTGESARYHIYWTQDRKRVAVAAIEEKFYRNLLDILQIREESSDQAYLTQLIQGKFSEKTLAEWKSRFANADACLSFIPSREEVLKS